MEGYKTIFILIAGLVLFLYAVNTLSGALKELAGDRMKKVLGKFTDNVFKGILSGLIVTFLLHSSSAAIIMTIALVNAGVLTFRQAMGVVMGANIGTTISSQLFALDIGEYAAVPILIGFLIMVISKQKTSQQVGTAILSFGLLFFGLYTMKEAVAPLKESDYFRETLQSLDNTWKGVATGAIFTLIIQSSSATVGMVISLASQGLITLKASIAVMLGAELGTCFDTLLSTIGRSRNAIRTGVFHLMFNIITITLGILSIGWFTQLILWISGDADMERKIANAHLIFNSLGVLVMIPFINLMERFMEKLIPSRRGKSPLKVK